jgi:pimeloyl-ACP methyl ester carboxylesterase
VILGAKRFKELFGSNYNWVGFDPRGVNNTGPPLSCSRTPRERELAALRPIKANVPFAELWALSKARGEYCSALNAETDTKYVGTFAVVQDMMHFTELQAAANGKAPEKATIWFYGVSYGTILGQTLATMFPDRLGKIILDGTVNAAEYYRNSVYSSLDSTDKSFRFFFKLCHEAGPKFCAFAGKASSPAEVERRFRRLLQRLEDEPLSLAGRPAIVSKWDVLDIAIEKVYSPMREFDSFATMLHELEQRNTTTWAQTLEAPTSAAGSCSPVRTYTQAAFQDAYKIIWSIDTAGRYVLKDYPDYELAVETFKSNSYYGWQEMATDNAIVANGMNITPPKSQFYEGPKVTHTNVPILFIGNTGDPATPLSSALNSSSYFPGSSIVIVDAPGHGSLGIPSRCLQEATVAYLVNGTLPRAGAVCGLDVKAEAFFGGQGSRKSQ